MSYPIRRTSPQKFLFLFSFFFWYIYYIIIFKECQITFLVGVLGVGPRLDAYKTPALTVVLYPNIGRKSCGYYPASFYRVLLPYQPDGLIAQLLNYAGGTRTRTIITKPKWVTSPLALTMTYRQCDLGSSQPSALPIELLQNDHGGIRTHATWETVRRVNRYTTQPKF